MDVVARELARRQIGELEHRRPPRSHHRLDGLARGPVGRAAFAADEHDRAMMLLDSLDDRRADLRTEEQDYFLVLALLVERYEDEIYPSREEAESR